MLLEALVWLFARQDRANDTVLTACRQLSIEEFTTSKIQGQRSVRDTLMHMFDVQTCHIGWISGKYSREESFARQFPPGDYPSVGAVEEFWQLVRSEASQYFAALHSDDDLVRPLRKRRLAGGSVVRYPWQVLLHVANHSTQHRSEVGVLLTRSGSGPGDLDLL